MAELTVYRVDHKDFIDRDALVLRKDDWREDAFRKQSITAIYAFFRMAHGGSVFPLDKHALKPSVQRIFRPQALSTYSLHGAI